MLGAPRITQETFDDCVKENMEDFDMERDAALKDGKYKYSRSFYMSGSGEKQHIKQNDLIKQTITYI
jgi:hypothetical protein